MSHSFESASQSQLLACLLACFAKVRNDWTVHVAQTAAKAYAVADGHVAKLLERVVLRHGSATVTRLRARARVSVGEGEAEDWTLVWFGSTLGSAHSHHHPHPRDLA